MMKNLKRYLPEYLLVLMVILISLTGFSGIYFPHEASATRYQNLHVVTSFIWLFLLAYQLRLIANNQYLQHRKVGLAILFFGPLVVASTALLTVHSAHKGVISGEGDILVVQNVTVTLELALVILLAFIVKKDRKLHGVFMLSTAMLFLGIALVFTLIGFVPQFRIEGPETFYRFATAAAAARYFCIFVGLLFFLRDRKYGWPMLIVGSFFSVNEFINTVLTDNELIRPLTEFVGSFNEVMIFVGSFVLFLAVLLVIGVRNKRPTANPAKP